MEQDHSLLDINSNTTGFCIADVTPQPFPPNILKNKTYIKATQEVFANTYAKAQILI